MATPEDQAERVVRIPLGERSYDAVVGAGLLAGLGSRIAQVCGRGGRAFLVADSGVPTESANTAGTSLQRAGFAVTRAAITPSEREKSLTTAETLLGRIARSRHERAEPVVALGGGIVCDLAGFAAAIYRRGVPIVQCPTTLLAMVDASVGGKTGVNLEVQAEGGTADDHLRKNMLGAFHQPSLVVCDVGTLASLARDELVSGLAECVKHGLISAEWGDSGLLDWTRSSAQRILALDYAAVSELIARNIAVKAAVVAQDEREQEGSGRGRMALNAGHTVAHAIETMPGRPLLPGGGPGPDGLKHGQAVGLGLIAEITCAEKMGVARTGLAREVAALLAALGLPIKAAGLPPADRIARAMLDDKKTSGGRIRLAVPTGSGTCRIIDGPTPQALALGLEAIRA